MEGKRQFVVSVALIALVGPLVIVTGAPALAEPCARVAGAGSAGTHLCWAGQTVADAPAAISDVKAGSFGGVAFLTFEVETFGRLSVFSRSDGQWSPVSPAGDGLNLRGQHEPAPVRGDEPYILVQLETPMVREWMDAFASSGVTVHAFVPDTWFLVRVAEATDDAAALSFVRATSAVAPSAKLEPGIVDETGPTLVNVLTVPRGPGAREAALEAIGALGGEVVADDTAIERITARLDAARLLELAALPDILWIDRAAETFENDMDLIRGMVGADYVASVPGAFRGAGVVGMVMDAGLQTTHPDFAASLLAVDGPNAPASHGTSVYGIVFGSGAGSAQAVGMAPDADGVFAWYSSGLSRYQHAANLRDNWGGVFHTNSWGRGVPKDNTYDSYSNENDRVVLELDVLMLQSMSNCGPDCARREAMAKNILSIGALYHMNTALLDDDRWNPPTAGSRASTGPAADGRIKPELVGPYDAIFTTTTTSTYTTGFGGTSGATPVVAGAVALTNEMYRDGVFGGSAGTPSPAAVRALLIASARPYGPDQVVHTIAQRVPGNLLARDIQGWGLPDLEVLHDGGVGSFVADETVPLETGEFFTAVYTAPTDATEVHFTLTWSDVPANPGASRTLVNNLDLEVRDAGGLLYRGNEGLRNFKFSTPAPAPNALDLAALAPDALNNVENVFIPLPVGGGSTWTVTVRGAAVNLDANPATPEVDQPFALVALPIR